MTPEEAARRVVACTAIGELSGLSKWEWRHEIRVASAHAFARSGRKIVLWVNWGKLHLASVGIDDAVPTAWHDAQHWLPDFTHEPTVLAVLPLVRRQYPGHVVDVTWHPSGNVDVLIFQPGLETVFVVDDVPLYEALTLALEAAPEKQS